MPRSSGAKSSLASEALVGRVDAEPMPNAATKTTRRRSAATFGIDRKSTRLNSSHLVISYAVFCLKKKSHRLRSRMLTQLPCLAPSPARSQTLYEVARPTVHPFAAPAHSDLGSPGHRCDHVDHSTH